MTKKDRAFILFVILLGVVGVIYFGINRLRYADLDKEVSRRNKENAHVKDGDYYSAVKHKTLTLIIEDMTDANGKPYKIYTAKLNDSDKVTLNNCDNIKDFGLDDVGKYTITVDALKSEGWGVYSFEIRKLYDYKKIE